jgi:hypothetical protein
VSPVLHQDTVSVQRPPARHVSRSGLQANPVPDAPAMSTGADPSMEVDLTQHLLASEAHSPSKSRRASVAAVSGSFVESVGDDLDDRKEDALMRAADTEDMVRCCTPCLAM